MAEKVTQTIIEGGAAPTHRNGRATVTLSNGNALSGAQDAGSIHIYEHPVDRHTAPTFRVSILPPVDYSEVVLSTFANNDIGVVIRSADGKTIRYCKITYATWAVSAWETIVTMAGASIVTSIDASVSDAGAVFVSYQTFNGVGTVAIRVSVRTTAGAWVHSTNTNYTSIDQAIAPACDATSIITLGSFATNVRDFMVVFAVGEANGTDNGIRLHRGSINESTGAYTQALTLQATEGVNQAAKVANSSYGQRLARLYRLANNEYALMYMHSTVNNQIGFRTGTYQNGVHTNKVTLKTYNLPTNIGSIAFMATAAKVPSARIEGSYYGTFVFAYTEVEGERLLVRSVVLRQTGSTTVASWSPGNVHGQAYSTSFSSLASQASGNLSLSQSDLVWRHSRRLNAPDWEISSQISYARMVNNYDLITSNPVIQSTPRGGAGVQTQNPTITATVEFYPLGDGTYKLPGGQSKYKLQFQYAPDSSFTTGVVDYMQDDSKFKSLGDEHNPVPHTITDVLPGAGLTAGVDTWYSRTRLVDEFYNYGPWHLANFVIGHPSIAIPIYPAPDKTYYHNNGLINFSWQFTDPSPTDYQTAYQVKVYSSSAPGGLVHDTGKVASADKSVTIQLPLATPGYWMNTMLVWEIKVWDSEDKTVSDAPLTTFLLTDPPLVDLDTVAGVAIEGTPTVATGVPNFAGTYQSGGESLFSGLRKLKEYSIVVSQSGVPIYTKRVNANLDDNTAVSLKMPDGYLQDGQSYTVQAFAIDDANILGSGPVYPFVVDWIPPATPSDVVVNTDLYNTEDEGYVYITWGDDQREVDNFTSWNVYRKADMIDENGVVVAEGNRELIGRVYTIQEDYEYKDYYAPANYKVSYWVTQSVIRDGQTMESGTEVLPVIVYPISDGYWLITPDSTNTSSDAFKLSIVTGDEFTEEQEESEFVVIGRGRQVQKGEALGAKGQLSCQLRNTGNTTARQKRMRLKAIQEAKGQMYLRNPFGDTFRVNVSGVTVSRIAGVGTSEFCDVSIPYAEVSQ